MDTITLKLDDKDCFSVKFGIKYAELWDYEIVLTKVKYGKYRFICPILIVTLYLRHYKIIAVKMNNSYVSTAYLEDNRNVIFNRLITSLSNGCYYSTPLRVDYPVYQLLNGCFKGHKTYIKWRNYIINILPNAIYIYYGDKVLFEDHFTTSYYNIEQLILDMKDGTASSGFYHLPSADKVKNALKI